MSLSGCARTACQQLQIRTYRLQHCFELRERKRFSACCSFPTSSMCPRPDTNHSHTTRSVHTCEEMYLTWLCNSNIEHHERHNTHSLGAVPSV